MAIVDDISRDRRTKNVLDQTNTKTVAAPPAATGLTDDQTPAEVFTVDDFNLVRNQVHLARENFQLLEALNVMGQITNTQSQSGPIGQGEIIKIEDTTGSGDPKGTILRPPVGEIWVLTGAQLGTFNGTRMDLLLTDNTNAQTLKLATENSGFAIFEPLVNAPHIYITNNLYLTYLITGASGTCIVKCGVQQVR